jgi:hypothetical protein
LGGSGFTNSGFTNTATIDVAIITRPSGYDPPLDVCCHLRLRRHQVRYFFARDVDIGGAHEDEVITAVLNANSVWCPFTNTLVTLKLPGAQLKKTLSWDLLAVSGVKVQLDLKKPAGHRLVSATLSDGTPIDDAQYYIVTTNDFVLAGGDGFSEVGKGADIKDTGILLRDVFVDYVKAHVVLSPALDCRVVVLK